MISRSSRCKHHRGVDGRVQGKTASPALLAADALRMLCRLDHELGGAGRGYPPPSGSTGTAGPIGSTKRQVQFGVRQRIGGPLAFVAKQIADTATADIHAVHRRLRP